MPTCRWIRARLWWQCVRVCRSRRQRIADSGAAAGVQKVDDAIGLKMNTELKHLVVNQALDIVVLKEVNRENL